MRTACLGEICDRTGGSIQTGPFGSQLHQSDYREQGVPVVMPQDIIDNRIDRTRISRIDEATADRLSRHYLSTNDIVFPRRGDIAKRAIVTSAQDRFLCGTGCLKISLSATEVDPKYLFYFLAQDHVVKWIEGKAVGATMLNLNTSILRSLPVTYPSPPIQKKTVAILAAYDDLIENNQRRIKLLEEAARRVYREWFVALRFPGHERVKVVDGVPQGWTQATLGDALQLQRGFDLPSGARKEGAVPIIASTGVTGFHDEARVSGPGVVTGRSGTLGAVHFVHEDFWPLNTSLWVKEFRLVTPLVAYFMLLELGLSQFNSGASVPTLDRKAAHPMPAMIPSKPVQAAFEAVAGPMFSQIRVLDQAASKARQARDALLPRLMSGALVV